MARNEFGAFRTTEETSYRPVRDSFRPRFSLDEAVRADLLAIEQADREIRLYEADEALARRLLREALARNTYGTVSIEGNPLSLDDVRSLLQNAPSPANALDPDERDVLNLAAFLAALDREELPSTPEALEEVHGRLFAGTVRDAGRFKRTMNFIGRAADRVVVYVPTPPARVRDEVSRALEWYGQAPDHPIVRVAVFFQELQAIHPFTDGNGRLGRAVAALQLHRAGYTTARYAPVDYAINQDRAPYYEALARSQGGDWDLTPWVSYFISVLRHAFEDALRQFLLRDALPAGLNERALGIVTWIARLDGRTAGRRVMVNDVHAAFPHVPRRTLQRDLAALVQAGILEGKRPGRGSSYALDPRLRQRTPRSA